MSWFTMDVACGQCSNTWDVMVPREDREKPVICPWCGGEATRVPSRPNNTRASFRDGVRRFDSLRTQDAIDRAISETPTTVEGVKERRKLLHEKEKAK